MTRFVAVPVLAACLAMADDVPTGGTAPADTRYPLRAECAVNLLEIGKWIRTYRLARDGQYPPRLSAVFDQPGTPADDLRALLCPAAERQVDRDRLVPAYAYVHVKTPSKPLPAGEPPPEPEPPADEDESGNDEAEPEATDREEPEAEEPFMLVFDAEPVHQAGRNVLFSDLRTRYLPESEFQVRLAEQKDRWDREGREYEIVWEDAIPLTEEQYAGLRTGGPRLLRSPHFVITVGLLIAIAVVLLALAALKKKQAAE